ncbi:MAG: hypothetical protein R3B57_02005 [Phycisphaerales bacterium]
MRELLRTLNRAQRSTPFKVVASIVVVVAAAAALLVLLLFGDHAVHADADQVELIKNVLSGSGSHVLVIMSVLIGLGVSLIVIWLGLALTYLALLVVSLAIGVPLLQFKATEPYGWALLGAVSLTFSFAALLQGLRLVFSAPGPVFAIARTVLAEAVRLKLSLVFIVMLVLALAAIPQLLDEAQPLRYRVQSFLQYATGGSFWIIALLTVFFSAATVAFEQRDKIIWQTMTKPVAPWQYILGKWVGVIGLVGVLLAVSASGVFLSTEYLRRQPAQGEITPYEPTAEGGDISEDRLILETQVLAARRSVGISLPFSIEDPAFTQAVEARIEAERQTSEQGDRYAATPEERAKIRAELFDQRSQEYRSIETGRGERYVFEGLSAARDSGLPITLRYRVDAEGNRPDRFYRVSFILPDGAYLTREVALGYTHTIPLSPDYIDADGRLAIEVINGELFPDRGGLSVSIGSSGEDVQRTITFPPGGLEISYAAGLYYLNFFRVMLVLWLKLAFLSMVAICAATFLNFPVACLLAVFIFLVAEGAGFITSSVELYGVTDRQGHLIPAKYVISSIASAVSSLFIVYADLRPTQRLVEGRLLSWGDVARGVIVLGAVSGALYALSVAIFRRRELAIYSGH